MQQYHNNKNIACLDALSKQGLLTSCTRTKQMNIQVIGFLVGMVPHTPSGNNETQKS
jgi:hypothetical protein